MGHHKLRISLLAVLTALATAGMSLSSMNASAVESLANNPSPRVSASASPTSTTVTPLVAKDQAVLDKIHAAQVKAGCNLNMSASTVAKSVGKCNIMLIGDSIGNNLASGLRQEIGKMNSVNFISHSKSSTGLSNSWFYNWPKKFGVFLKEAAAAKRTPNLVVVMIGANDRQDMKVNNKVLKFGSKTWTAEYTKYIQDITTRATKVGAYVVWVGLPVMQPKKYGQGMQVLNSIYESATKNQPGVSFVSTHSYFADASGKFQAWAKVNGKRSKIRGDDGIHMANAGQPVLGTYVVKAMNDIFNVKFSLANERNITN
jgi:hypothetical protein